MRYYVYVSEAKVEQLYSQVPAKLRSKIAAKFTIDLKLLKGEFAGRQSQESLFSKLQIVRDYLESTNVIGTVDDPRSFFAQTMPLSWGIYGGRVHGWDDSIFVYFGARTEETVLGMGGSLHHVIGEPGKAVAHSHSATPTLTNALSMAVPIDATEPEMDLEKHLIEAGNSANQPHSRRHLGMEQVLHSVWLASTQIEGPREPMEFVAKRLVGGDFCGKKVLLGTPLYVALI
jgi:hypothetical protein